MNCPNCEKPVPEGAVFCIYCGTPVSSPVAVKARAWQWPVVGVLLALALVAAGLLYWFVGRQGGAPVESTAAVTAIVQEEASPAEPPAASTDPAPTEASAANTEPTAAPNPTKTPAPTVAPTAEATTAVATATTATTTGTAEIVFQSNRDGDYDIYIMALDGGNVRALTNNADGDNYPRVSPDGRRIVFQSDRDGNQEIYVMARDGSGQTRLTTDPANDRLPAWSPDGTQIVFSSQRSGAADLYVIDANGGNLRQVTATPQRDGHVAWGSGGRLAYNVTVGGVYQVYTNNTAGTDPLRLNFSTGDEWSAEWSPDGQTLLFLTERDGGQRNSAIYMMDANGGNQRPLYDSPAYEWSPAWSADGAYVLFALSDNGLDTDRDDIYIMNADGSGARLVAQHGSYPAWAVPLHR